jgi:hypothetical protein
MKAKFPRFAPCLLLLFAALAASCNRAEERKGLKLRISQVTHIAAGQSFQLSAYQEYLKPARSSSYGTVEATTNTDFVREPVEARWEVTDASIAQVAANGMLTALKPGKVQVKGYWQNYEAKINVEVLKNLSVRALPQLSAQGMKCSPEAVSLNLTTERTLSFRLTFAGNLCRELSFEKKVEEAQLPWRIDSEQGQLQIETAAGHVVTGEFRAKEGGTLRFTAWADGAGNFPVSLKGKKVLLIGDSMAEGIGWFLRGKVEEAGGQYIGEPWCSSTTYSWYDTGRFDQMMERYHPDIIFIALGSNELFNKQAETSAPIIQEMVRKIGDRPAFWIGPPSWKPDKGIVGVIESNFQPGHFYNANSLEVPRGHDKIHPTRDGFKTWTNLIWDWYAGLG